MLLQSCWRCLGFPACKAGAAGTGVVSRLLPDPQHLRGDPTVCEGSLLGSGGADLWDRAQLAPAQSLRLLQFLGRGRTRSLRAISSPYFRFSL